MSRNSRLRASDDDRDRVVARLRQAAVEGRIGHDELDARVSQALAARTYGDLEAVVDDLPQTHRGGRSRGGSHGAVIARRATGAVRANPALLVLAVPVIAVTGALLLAFVTIWTLFVLALVLSGGRSARRRPPPWFWRAGPAAAAAGPLRAGADAAAGSEARPQASGDVRWRPRRRAR